MSDLSKHRNIYIGFAPFAKMPDEVLFHMDFVAYYDSRYGSKSQYLNVIKNRYNGRVGWRTREEVDSYLKRMKKVLDK